METERSPFGRKTVPRYTFLKRDEHPPKLKIKRFQCCFCGAFITLLIAALLIAISFYLHVEFMNSAPDNDSQNSKNLSQLNLPLRDQSYTEEGTPSLTDQVEAFKAGVESLKLKESIENDLPSVPPHTSTFRHQLATPTSKEAHEMSKLGYIINSGSKDIRKRLEDSNFNLSSENKCKGLRKWRFIQSSEWFLKNFCGKNVTFECPISRYRTADGTCNNVEKNSKWGAALRPFRRILLPNYADGISDPRKASDGSILPSAREVSLLVHKPFYKNDVNFTVMLAVWGQFIDHDITATALSKGKDGAAISCCHLGKQKRGHPECFPVLLNESDPFYGKFNLTCMEFVRSAPAPLCAFGPREQLNQVTSFLDGSVVYGSSEEVMNELRTFKRGELKVLNSSFGTLLPISRNPNDGCNKKEEFKRGRYCFLSGDARSNENLLLTSMHLLFVRQHNLIAKELAELNSKWTDEELFQESRKIVTAQIQHITYNEFLPAILPVELLISLNMTAKNSGYCKCYNSSLNPTIANSFASASFRFGHTLIPALIQYLRENGTKEEYIELHKILFNPFKLFEMEFLKNLMSGALNTSTEKADVYFNKEVTQKMFQNKEKGPCGLDLVSLNIQRGRDHGLPPYPDWRQICGLLKPNNFNDLKNDIDSETLNTFKKLYKSVHDIDLYSGALAEKPVKNGLLGPTFTCLLADQFLRLKKGDRFWYETEEEPQKFTPGQLNEIRKTTLAKIMCKTSGINKAQPFIMRRPGPHNYMKNCDKFSYPNFGDWIL